MVREAKSLQKISVLYSAKDKFFHDLVFLRNDQLIFSEGSSRQPKESIVNFCKWNSSNANAEIIKQVNLPGVIGSSVHFLALPNGRVLVVPISQEPTRDGDLQNIVAHEKSFQDRHAKLRELVKYLPTPCFIFTAGGKMIKLWPEKGQEMQPRNLSACRMGEFLGVTHPAGHSLTIWRDNRFVERIALGVGDSPAGIAYSNHLQEFVIADLANGILRFYSMADFCEKKDLQMHLKNGGATHLLSLA